MIKALFTAFLLFPLWANATTYYVRTTAGCSDSNTGQSNAQAWCTVGKVNSTVSGATAGHDVYFLAGGVWYERLKITFGGTSGDRTIIGSYYMSGSETVGVPNGTNPPTFQGTYNSAGDAVKTSGAIPNGQYKGMIAVDTADYVTVQDVKVIESAGEGINFIDSDYAIIQNTFMNYTVNSCWTIQNGDYAIVQGNEWTQCGVGWKNQDRPQDPGAGYPMCGKLKSLSNYGLVQNNYAHECWGEAIGSLKNGAGYNIIRANKIVQVRASIRLDNSSNEIVENNLIVGAPGDNTFDFGDPRTVDGHNSGITVAVEEYASAKDSKDNIIRNNTLIYPKNCLGTGIEGAAKTSGALIGFDYYNNTCIAPMRGINMAGIPAANITTTNIKNNIIFTPFVISPDTTTGEICDVATDVDVTFSHNMWGVNPADADCDNANDIIGETTLARTDFTTVGLSDVPTPGDWEPAASSTVENKGTDLTGNHTGITTVLYPQYTSITHQYYGVAGTTFDTNIASRDFVDGARTTTPEMGSMEIGGGTPPPTAITRPYYNNSGAGAIGPLASGKSYSADAYYDATQNYIEGTVAGTIDLTSDDALFQSNRQSKPGYEIIYNIPDNDVDDFDLILHFAEPFYTGDCTGLRKFDIYVEGVLEFNDFDICSYGGTAPAAVTVTAANKTRVGDTIDLRLAWSTDPTVDGRPVIAGWEVVDATPGVTETVIVGVPTASITLSNLYPEVSNLTATNTCQVYSTTGDPIRITNIDITSFTGSGSWAISTDSSDAEYTPLNLSEAGDLGNVVITFSDGNDTDTCTITVNMSGEKKLQFTVFDTAGGALTSTTDWAWCWRTYGENPRDNNQNCGTDETTDANGVMIIYDSRLPNPGAGVNVHVYIFNKTSVTGTDGARIYRSPNVGRVKVTQ